MIPLDEHEKESRAIGVELRDCLLFCAVALALALLTILIL